MSQAPNEKVHEAHALYLKGMPLIDISTKLNLPAGTVRRWKSSYKWEAERSGESERSEKKNKGGQPGNKNAVGNNGGAPSDNKNAEKHGFFSKWLPEETREIIGAIETSNPLDLLWDNIQLQYAAIIRAQKLMHVKDQKDLTKELKRQKESSGEMSDSWEKEYELQFAWDKHANFLQAQSRAMKTLESMIRQYDDMLHKDWDSVTEEQKARIAVLKAKAQLGDSGDAEDDGFIDALSGKVVEAWQE